MVIVADSILAARLLLRSRFGLLSFWLVVVLLSFVLMASQFSGRQPATVGVDVGLSVLRLIIPLFLALSVQELFSREFDRKYYFYSLSYPRSRTQMLFGRFIAVFGIALVLTLVGAILIVVLSKIIGYGYSQSTSVNTSDLYWAVIGFMLLDFFVLAAFAVLLGVVSKSPGFVLIGTFGFMLVARSYSTVVNLLKGDIQLVVEQDLYSNYLSFLRFLIPDLGALDIRAVSLYSSSEFFPGSSVLLVFHALLYGCLLLMLSMVILHNRSLE